MWYSLGIQLGLLTTTLKEIEANHRGDVGRCLAECLESWINNGDHCTWDSLEDALEKIGGNTTAIEIRDRSKEIIIILFKCIKYIWISFFMYCYCF